MFIRAKDSYGSCARSRESHRIIREGYLEVKKMVKMIVGENDSR